MLSLIFEFLAKSLSRKIPCIFLCLIYVSQCTIFAGNKVFAVRSFAHAISKLNQVRGSNWIIGIAGRKLANCQILITCNWGAIGYRDQAQKCKIFWITISQKLKDSGTSIQPIINHLE